MITTSTTTTTTSPDTTTTTETTTLTSTASTTTTTTLPPTTEYTGFPTGTSILIQNIINDRGIFNSTHFFLNPDIIFQNLKTLNCSWKTIQTLWIAWRLLLNCWKQEISLDRQLIKLFLCFKMYSDVYWLRYFTTAVPTAPCIDCVTTDSSIATIFDNRKLWSLLFPFISLLHSSKRGKVTIVP